jgi:hypothetical protein
VIGHGDGRRRRADAEAGEQDCGQRERRRTSQHAQRIPEILGEDLGVNADGAQDALDDRLAIPVSLPAD